MNDNYDNAELSIIRARALLSVLIAATMSKDYEPEPDHYTSAGFIIDDHLGEAAEALSTLRESLKAKPDEDSPETMPAHNDVQRMLRIHDLIDKIEDEELKQGMKRAWLQVGKPFLGVELGFIEKPETTTEGVQ